MNKIIFPGPGNSDLEIGKKAELLCALARMKFNVPEFFIIASRDIQELFPAKVLRVLCDLQAASGLPAATLESLAAELSALLPADFIAEVDRALANLDASASAMFAVRSSGLYEDTKNASLAGQYESKVFVPRAGIVPAIMRVWLSGLHPAPISYLQSVIPDTVQETLQLPSVIVQKMIFPQTAGVAFSANPVSFKDEIVIEAVLGHGHGLVSGELDADHWRINTRNQVIAEVIADKPAAYYFNKEAGHGLVKRAVDAAIARKPCLSSAQIRTLVQQTCLIARRCRFAADIEWGWSNEKLYILQVRPITGVPVSPEKPQLIYDNSNIAESYPGVTTVLTYSFASHAYEHVYRTFCRELGVPAARLAQKQKSLQNMLALIRGRMYYNLNSWYHLLSLLPGYDLNRKFMEGMMGVEEGFNPPTEPLADSKGRKKIWAKCCELFLVFKSLVLLLWNFGRQKAANKAFSSKVRQVLANSKTAKDSLPSLLAGYHRLEEGLLCNWRAPINNDFYCMILFGVFKIICCNWLADKDGRLLPGLLFLGEEVVSSKPFYLIKAMAEIVKNDPALVRILCEANADFALVQLRRNLELSRLFDQYMDNFGCRCLEELKLETVTLQENPEPLLRSIGNAAGKMLKNQYMPVEQKLNTDLVAAREILKGSPSKLCIFLWLRERLVYSLTCREELRFLRTLVFGKVRQIYLSLGGCFSEAGILNAPRDIFHLTRQEVFDLAAGKLPYKSIIELVNLRRKEYEDNCAACDPPGRLTLDSPLSVFSPSYDLQINSSCVAEKSLVARELKGLGCSAGVVHGRVKVVSDPLRVKIEPGEIIVARHTDPGWVLILPAAAGLIVEFGGTLSHAAIVARELGVPCVTGIKAATLILEDGDYISMDGSSGLVVIKKNGAGGLPITEEKNNVDSKQDAA